MRKYYLFLIQTEYNKLYLKNSKFLYGLLYNLYQLKEPNLNYGISLFKSICQPFSVNLLSNYIQSKYTCTTISPKVMKVHSIYEKTTIQINYGCIIVIGGNTPAGQRNTTLSCTLLIVR